MGAFFVFVCIVFLLSDLTNAQNACKTPKNKDGSCMQAKQCTALYAIALNFEHATIEEKLLLRGSRCGTGSSGPLLCCEQPEIADRNSFEEKFPPPGECGTSLKDRIVGGTEAPLTDYRWFALIQYDRPGGKSKFLCGGSLIHKDYVLTAAHCLDDRQLVQSKWRATSVRLGEHDLDSEPDCEEGECADPAQDVPIAELIIHEQFDKNSANKHNDIALIRLQQSITFTDWIKPVCLPFAPQLKNKNFDHVPMVVVGFGRFDPRNATQSSIKLMVEVNGTNWNRCNNIFNRELISKQLCAGGAKGKDSCKGDSGGPLMATDNTDPLLPYIYLAGIVSRGSRYCGAPGYPGVYTKVDQYLDWIVEHMIF